MAPGNGKSWNCDLVLLPSHLCSPHSSTFSVHTLKPLLSTFFHLLSPHLPTNPKLASQMSKKRPPCHPSPTSQRFISHHVVTIFTASSITNGDGGGGKDPSYPHPPVHMTSTPIISTPIRSLLCYFLEYHLSDYFPPGIFFRSSSSSRSVCFGAISGESQLLGNARCHAFGRRPNLPKSQQSQQLGRVRFVKER